MYTNTNETIGQTIGIQRITLNIYKLLFERALVRHFLSLNTFKTHNHRHLILFYLHFCPLKLSKVQLQYQLQTLSQSFILGRKDRTSRS